MSETSIPLDFATRDRLRSLGSKGETWIVLVNKILDVYERCKKVNTKDVTEEVQHLKFKLPEAVDYALHFVTEDRSVSFKFSDVKVTIEPIGE